MYNNSKIAKAVRLAMIFGAASAATISTQAFSADEENAEEEIEKIEVTGSRIKRTDMEGASPITVITTAEFEKQGRISVADALRNVTSNSFSSFVPSSGSSAQSQSTVDLLGVGSGRTLVLLDGKRIAGSPTLGGSSANLSSIPMAAVERIEILKDGASAIYGSDAIAGVVNIVLKKDYEGVSASVQIGRPENEKTNTKSVSFSMGVSSDKGNITFVYDHQEQGAIFDKDRPYSAARWDDTNGDGLISMYTETEGVSFYGASIINPNTGAFEPSPECDNLMSSVDGFVGKFDQGPYLGGVGGGNVCAYAYANVSANMASTNRDAILTSANYELTDDLELYARAMFSRNDSFGRYAPPAARWNNIPANSANNPYDEETVGFFRWYGIGTRDGNVTDYQQDYMIGLKGSLGDSVEWELSYHRARLDYREAGRSYLSYGGLAYNIANGIDLGTEQGVANMSATTYTENQNDFEQYYFGLGFEAGELSGGAIQFYIGAEYFEQNFASKYDKQSEAGLIGGSAGNSAAGYRDTKAVFGEISLPFTDELIVSAAYRYDKYSDFGSKGTPSLKVEYRPLDDLLLRASYSKGFRAPSLDDLLAATSFSATSAVDYVSCQAQGIAFEDCGSRQYDNLIESNPNLGAEESTYANAGLVYSGIENFSVKLDYFDLEVTNVIASITPQSLINMELGGILDDFTARYPGVKLVRDANGNISEDIVTRSENGAVLTRQGFDLELEYLFETSFGDFSINSATTYLTEAGSDVFFGGPKQNKIGAPGMPKWRSQLVLDYNLDALNVNWTVDVIASTYEDSTLDTADGNPDNFRQTFANHNSAYVIHNLNVKYDIDSYGIATVGVRNIFDKGVLKTDDGFWINDNLYLAGHIGRELYAGYTINF